MNSSRTLSVEVSGSRLAPELDVPGAMRLAIISAIMLAFSSQAACAQEQSKMNKASLREDPTVVCGVGLARGDCELAKGIVRLALSRLSTSVSGWRFVVVSHSLWDETTDLFHIKRLTPAFSSLGMRTTYVESNLVFQDGRVDENLQRYTIRTGIDRLTWVMAHEYGHILCQTTDEQRANAAAGRLMFGRKEVCR